MQDAEHLRDLLLSLDGRGYKAYKDAEGAWAFADFTLHVDHVQGDPFADPSRIRVFVPGDVALLPRVAWSTPSRACGASCFLARAFSARARGESRRMGTGRGGEIRMVSPGQQTLEQSAVRVHDDGSVEARFTVGLPARGRRVMGPAAATLLVDVVPGLVHRTLLTAGHPEADLLLHADVNEDADHLRAQLTRLGLVAFVADGAELPRRSGVDERPLTGPSVVPFRSPASLRVVVDVPNAGSVSGMGVPRGVTLLVGGGFHGKSTVLRALSSGVYNHPPGDGRERVVAVDAAVKVRAEDGRPVTGVDISAFIGSLPDAQDTRCFTTSNASGSTSQAAAIVEAMEAGAEVLLMDEDTSATNFMIRDRRMQALVPRHAEPITPFVDRARELYLELGVSTVLVLGGSGDYLDVADTVIALRGYEPRDVTTEARGVAATLPTGRTPEVAAPLGRPAARIVDLGSLDPRKGRKEVHVKVPDTRTLLFGTQELDLVAVEQIVSRAQLRTIGRAMAAVGTVGMEPGSSLAETLCGVERLLADEGLDVLDRRRPGDLVAFRRFELAAAINRLRTLRLQD